MMRGKPFGSKVAFRFIFSCVVSAVLSLLVWSLPAVAAINQRWCELVLTGNEYESRRQLISDAIRLRTEPLRAGRAEIAGLNGQMIDVLEGINRELAKPLLDFSKRQAMERVAKLADLWKKAVREDLKARYASKTRAENFVVTENNLPDSLLVKNNRARAIELVRARNAMRANEFEVQLSQLVIDEIRKTYSDQLRDAGSEIIEAEADALATSLNTISPNWLSIHQMALPVINEMAAKLADNYPLEGSVVKGAAEARELAVMPLDRPLRAAINKDGVPEVIISGLGVRAYYDLELGTVVLESDKGLAPNDKGMIVAIDHGAGTTVSNASSWKYILHKVINANLNPFAMNMPLAGIGMPLEGFLNTLAYSHKRFELLRQVADSLGKSFAPLVSTGRSVGALLGMGHAMMFEGVESNPVDLYILYSFSNPYTMDEQIEAVNQQVRNGTVKGVVQASLDNALKMSEEFREILAKLKAAEDPAEAELRGDNCFAVQGEGDRDGSIPGAPIPGPGEEALVVRDLIKFKNEHAPSLHVFVIKDRLLRNRLPNLEKIGDDHLEAQHNPLSNYANMRPEAGLLFMINLASKDAREAARYDAQGYGLLFAYADSLIANGSSRPELKDYPAILRSIRIEITGSYDETYLDWYLRSSGVEPGPLLRAIAQREQLSPLNQMAAPEALKDFVKIDVSDLPAPADQTFMVLALNYAAGDYMVESGSPKSHMQRAAEKFRRYREVLTGSEDRRLLDWYREANGISIAEYAAARPGYDSKASRLKMIEVWIDEELRQAKVRYDRYEAARRQR